MSDANTIENEVMPEQALAEAEAAFALARERYERAERQHSEAVGAVGAAKQKLAAVDAEAVEAAHEGRYVEGDLEAAQNVLASAERREKIHRAACERPRREFEQAERDLDAARVAIHKPLYYEEIHAALLLLNDVRDHLNRAAPIYERLERSHAGVVNLHAALAPALLAPGGAFDRTARALEAELTPPEVRKRAGVVVIMGPQPVKWAWHEFHGLVLPRPGETAELPAEIAGDLIRSGLAERVDMGEADSGLCRDVEPTPEPERPGLVRRLVDRVVGA